MSRKSKPPALNDRLKAIADRPPPAFEASTSSSRPPRAPTFKQAVLTLEHGERLPVVIKNLSKTGARVEFFQNRDVEEDAYVRLSEGTTALNRAARVIWKKQGLLGLKFVAE